MSKEKEINKYVLFNNLFDLFLDERYDLKDEELFKEWEIDVSSIVKKNIILFRQLKTRARAELYQAKYNRIKEFLSKLKYDLESNLDEFKRLADEIFSKPKFAGLQPMFRNLTTFSENDKKSMLLDAKLLDLLGEIEEKFNKDGKNHAQ